MSSFILQSEKTQTEKIESLKSVHPRRFLGLIFLLMVSLIPLKSFAQKKSTRKVQEVNFAEMSLKGTLRNPEGAFLVQKRGIRFLPLYDLQKSMDEKIRESSDYIK